MANFKTLANVQYNEFRGSVAADTSSALLESFTCDFFKNNPRNIKGRKVNYTDKCVDAIRIYMREDLNIFYVDLRLRDLKTQHYSDQTFENVSANDILSLFKRFELVLKREVKK